MLFGECFFYDMEEDEAGESESRRQSSVKRTLIPYRRHEIDSVNVPPIPR